MGEKERVISRRINRTERNGKLVLYRPYTAIAVSRLSDMGRIVPLSDERAMMMNE